MSYAIKGPAEVRDYEARVPERPERERRQGNRLLTVLGHRGDVSFVPLLGAHAEDVDKRFVSRSHF